MWNRPKWYKDEYDNGWQRVKAAFRNDWEQTKHDFGSKTAPDLNQDVPDTVRQAAGKEDPFDRHEDAFRFGYAAQSHYRSQYPSWNNDLEKTLQQDYGTDWNRDRDYVRRAYEYRYSGDTSRMSSREEVRH